jgi:glycerol-3-phosphate acyltransferase PlsY
MAVIAALALGYLLGSIPFGLLLTRAAGLGDVRSIGSGNIGATNVLRTGKRGLALATLLLDALKGTAAVLLSLALFGEDLEIYSGFAAFIGHIFPVWLKFKGGKGVATYLGVLTGLHWPAAIAFAIIWAAVAFLSRFSSLAALTATLVVPVFIYLLGLPKEAFIFFVMTSMVYYTHRSNIRRLLNGTESKIGAGE